MRKRPKVLAAAATTLLLGAPVVPAEPTASAVLSTCQNALDSGFAGVEADICDWYITPCPCSFVEAAAEGEWCLPKDLNSADLARLVVNELSGQPKTLSQPASKPIIEILRIAYPCDG